MIKIPLKKSVNESYKIYLESGILKRVPEFLLKNNYGNKYVIITDSNVKKLYAEKLQKLLSNNNIVSYIISFPAGEKSKSLQQTEKICSQMNILGIERSDCIIALGGGVTGDLAGFIASIYLRGINYIQIPTSLLAMTDSSIGGKTGVDTESGKNLIGCFKQPKAVFIDPSLLLSLPEVEVLNGMAEVIKHGVIGDKSLIRFIEKNLNEILALNEKKVIKMLKKSIKVKKKIVCEDEFENGVRVFLNYGHTIGHALEKVSNYQIPHGQAVAIGMFLINKIAMQRRALKEKEGHRINSLLYKTGLPNKVPDNLNMKDILTAMKNDKKSKNGIVWYIVPQKIGKMGITADITASDLEWAIKGK